PSKDDHLALVHVGGGLTLREAFAKLRHGDGRQHHRIDPDLDERRPERQRIDDGAEHAHVVAGHPVSALGGDRHPAEDVAAADHDADLYAQFTRLSNICCDAIDNGYVDAEALASHQRFT